MKKFIKNNGTFIALIVLVIILSFASPSFLSSRNLTNLVRQVTINGIIAVGMTMVILLAGIDLSVGSVVGLSAVAVTLLMQAGLGIWLAILITLVGVGGVIGFFNGFMSAKFDIHPFIITLGIMTIARGLSLVLTQGVSVPVTNMTFAVIGSGYIPKLPSLIILVIALILGIFAMFKTSIEVRKGEKVRNKAKLTVGIILIVIGFIAGFYSFIGYQGIPIPVAIFAVVVMAGAYTLRKTRFGRKLYAIGGNEEVAWLSGINILRSKTMVFVITGVLSAASGILLASRLNGASPNLGDGFELDAIASVIIGGTSFMGGVGTVTGTVIGAIIIGVINNGMSLLGINSFYQMIVKGFIIILAVMIDVLNRKETA
ncbi:D-xylose transport system permease protein [Halanaerobium saccharolyticum]|uniref:D-xylose transport system permease protein n=1 Tax=Halanaerobium saccharolyticum TaxID=43595 RepID=A0A4R7YR31_9FIRM|nr:inner-membrane translocator [Halanaerobium saccharolyticum]RAK04929.1 D-xylose transport system permease protein [Halanaerobium saccharolyticum]TDV98301.1 D-xylose transport system permease protein [Halanaerobium saccharolyticum]TDX51239.1 D-xylose transport system permease protein [Halanaerobium saccharolyticum]